MFEYPAVEKKRSILDRCTQYYIVCWQYVQSNSRSRAVFLTGWIHPVTTFNISMILLFRHRPEKTLQRKFLKMEGKQTMNVSKSYLWVSTDTWFISPIALWTPQFPRQQREPIQTLIWLWAPNWSVLTFALYSKACHVWEVGASCNYSKLRASETYDTTFSEINMKIEVSRYTSKSLQLNLD